MDLHAVGNVDVSRCSMADLKKKKKCRKEETVRQANCLLG